MSASRESLVGRNTSHWLAYLVIRCKNALKKIPIFVYANEKIKARQIRKVRSELVAKYHALCVSRGFDYSPEQTLSTVRDCLRARCIKGNRESGKKPHVFWIGANWDQDNSGFISSMSRLADVSYAVTRTGRYGHAISTRTWTSGEPDWDIIRENDEQLIGQISAIHAKRPLDLVWGQMWASYVSPSTLHKVQQLGIPVANVAMDDRLPGHWSGSTRYRLGSIGLAGGVDLVLTTSKECCAWYGCEGVPALFWPLASDPAHFRPTAEAEKCFDISFVGNRYGIRGRIVESLIKAGLEVAAFGGGWPRGYVDAGKVSEIFARSRIVLGIGTIAHNDDIFTLKLRDFDAPMSGALYITHRNPDLIALYNEGEEIECYETVSECIAKMHYYLKNIEKRCEVARAGRERALRQHTWDARIKQAFVAVGIVV